MHESVLVIEFNHPDWLSMQFESPRNSGVKRLPVAIDWFLGNVERGIILEDDVIVDPSLFRYVSTMLDLYQSDPRVLGVCGSNLVPDSELDANMSYRFSSHPYVWDGQLGGGTPLSYLYWRSNFERVASGKIDKWDVQCRLVERCNSHKSKGTCTRLFSERVSY